MRLQKQKTRKVDDKEYYRWAVVIPPDKVEGLSWQEGTELEAVIRNDELVIKRKRKAK